MTGPELRGAAERPDPEPAKRPAFEPADRLLRAPDADPGMKRPATTVAGTVLVLLRVLAGVLWVVDVALPGDTFARDASGGRDDIDLSPEIVTASLVLFLVAAGLVLVVEVLFVLLIYRGVNWPRVVVMAFAVVSISTSFVAWWAQGQEITLKTSLVSLALDILVLLALSSRSAAAYARRNASR